MSKVTTILMLSAIVMFVVSPAVAHPVCVYGVEGPQDPLGIYDEVNVHECGDLFPIGEEIVSLNSGDTYETACFDGSDDPAIMNVVVEIMNLSCCDSCPLWYVADPGTTITNFDGFIGNCGMGDAEEAFRIDNVGINRPLIYESITYDNLFQPGEIWQFIIQDFQAAGGGLPIPFDTKGIASTSAGVQFSTGSIITPEPATMALLALGGIGVLMRRRRK